MLIFVKWSEFVSGAPGLGDSTFEVDPWKLLRVFESRVRVGIVKLLLQLEWRSLSDIARKLENDLGWKMTLPGLLKHMKELEDAGILRRESGIFADKPDARKTIYFLEGKERVERILAELENNVEKLLLAGVIFSETARLARSVQSLESRQVKEERKRLESLLAQCESEKVYTYLTDDERKKVKLWRMMMPLL
jgi:DNA-binding transcriptional ArsR family regulator